MEGRNTYIQNNDDVEAMRAYLELLPPMGGVAEISVLEACGRVTAEAVFARFCDPVYNAAAMDGIAVVAEKTFAATEQKPLTLTEGEDFYYINTGGALKGDYDSVIMIEDVLQEGGGKVKIISPAYPWQHIRTVGESIVSGEMVLPSNHKVRPIDLGALIASGAKTIKVYQKPRVGIIPTGTELIEDPDQLAVGKLMESNSRVFAALAAEYGGEPMRYSPIKDDKALLRESLARAVAENDLVIVNAGSSAGTKDYSAGIIAELGQVVVHGVAIKPGKPTILGIIDGKPVIGIPGYPVSAYLVFELFVRPLLLRFTGQENYQGEYVTAVLTKRIVSSLKNAELLRVALGYVEGKLVATPLDRGAAAVMSLVKADGILVVPRLTEGIEAGEQVSVRLIKPLALIKETLVITGSHDLIIDVLADKMKISSAHVGSMGGIMAQKRGECHLSPIHLLDEATGEYNISYVKQYFPKQKMALIKGVGRIQGLMVEAGNPLGIKDFNDLRSRKLRFANRQKGSGTRILFDYQLKKLGISAAEINGYEKELNTHMAVAISVKNSVADCGLGVLSAAKAMGLDFIPVGMESYDFLVPERFLADERVQNFIHLLKSRDFQNKLAEMGGYDCARTGEIQIIE